MSHELSATSFSPIASLFSRCSLFVNPAERLGTVPYSLVARCSSPLVVRQPCGTVGNRSLQPRCSLLVSPSGGGRGEVTRCSLLVAFPFLLFINPAERLGTVPYNLVARVPLWRGQGEVTRCSSLVASHCVLVAHCSPLFSSLSPIASRPSPIFSSFPLNLNYLTLNP